MGIEIILLNTLCEAGINPGWDTSPLQGYSYNQLFINRSRARNIFRFNDHGGINPSISIVTVAREKKQETTWGKPLRGTRLCWPGYRLAPPLHSSFAWIHLLPPPGPYLDYLVCPPSLPQKIKSGESCNDLQTSQLVELHCITHPVWNVAHGSPLSRWHYRMFGLWQIKLLS